MKIRTLLCCLFVCSLFSAVDAQKRPLVDGHKLLAHPRLLFTKSDEARIKRLLPRSPLLQEMKAALLRQANREIAAPLPSYGADPRTGNMLNVARDEIRRFIDFALAYRLTGDVRYLQATERELQTVCAWTDWWPKHFLEPAALSVGVALAYDWTYYNLSPDTRNLVERTLCTHALEYAVRAYQNPTKSNWAAVSSNWNTACNGAMLLAALSIAERDTALAASVVRNVVRYLPKAQASYAPDGVAYEGSFYWGYAGTYLCMTFDALRQNFGTDFGLSENSGMKGLADSYLKIISPAGRVFCFADGGERMPFLEPVYFYYSRHFGAQAAAPFYRDLIRQALKNEDEVPINFFYLNIPWFDESQPRTAPQRQRLQTVLGPNEMIVLQGTGAHESNVWLAAKGGIPTGAHQHLDMGTFELEADSVMWFADMGREQSSLPGYWDSNNRRWHYFREGCLSHNVCTVGDRFQNHKGRARISATRYDGAQPYAAFDLTAAYPEAEAVSRTFCLEDNGTILLTDSFCLKTLGESVTWNAMTQADVKIDGKRAVLSSGGKKFYATVVAPEGASFSLKPVTLEHPDIETPCDGWQHLQVRSVAGAAPFVLKVRLSTHP